MTPAEKNLIDHALWWYRTRYWSRPGMGRDPYRAVSQLDGAVESYCRATGFVMDELMEPPEQPE